MAYYPLKPGRLNVPVIILGTVDIDKIGLIRRVTSSSSQKVIVNKIEKIIINDYLKQLVP